MNLPKLDIASLPDLDAIAGLFDTIVAPAKATYSDDTIIVLMTFIYELLYP